MPRSKVRPIEKDPLINRSMDVIVGTQDALYHLYNTHAPTFGTLDALFLHGVADIDYELYKRMTLYLRLSKESLSMDTTTERGKQEKIAHEREISHIGKEINAYIAIRDGYVEKPEVLAPDPLIVAAKLLEP